MLPLSENREFKIRFLSISAIIFIFIYPIIHADVYYGDDYVRSIAGYIGMAGDGRYLSEILIHTLSLSKHVCDTAPLFQLLSVIVLAFSLSFLSVSWNFGRFSSIFILPLIPCSSFFLENLSFRYDSLTMACALSCACLAYCKWSVHDRTSFLIKCLFILASLNFYQPAINVFLCLTCFGGLLRLEKSGVKEALKFLIYNLFSALIAIFIYIMGISIYNNSSTYYHKHSEFTYNIYDIFGNISHFLNISFREFGLHGKGFETFLGVFLLLSVSKVLWVSYRKYNIRGFVVSSLYIGLSICFLPGLLVFLKYATFDQRVFMSNGVFLCMYIMFIIGENYKFSENRIKACLPISVLFIQISLAFCWGNALKAQTSLNEYITRSILEEISTMSSSKKTIYIRFTSAPPPVSPQAQMIWSKRRAIFESFEMTFPIRGWIEEAQDLHKNEYILGGLVSKDKATSADENKNFSIDNAENMLRLCHFQKSIHHRYYNMYVDKQNVLIDFSQTCSGQ